MLLNGLRMEGKTDVIVGDGHSFCLSCAADLVKKENIPYDEAVKKLRGKYAGQMMKSLPLARDRNYDRVLLCRDCIARFDEELNS